MLATPQPSQREGKSKASLIAGRRLARRASHSGVVQQQKAEAVAAAGAAGGTSSSSSAPSDPDHAAAATEQPSPDDLIGQIKQRDLPQKLREQISRINEQLLSKLSRQADQLRVVGGDRDKLKRQDIAEEHANECALARLAHRASELAHAAGKAYEMSLHDPLTLLKSPTFFGFLLNALGGPAHSRFRCVWACAGLDLFPTVQDRWSSAHGDYALILASRAIQAEVDKWNEQHGRQVGHAVAMRLGGDTTVLVIVLRESAAAAGGSTYPADAVSGGSAPQATGAAPAPAASATAAAAAAAAAPPPAAPASSSAASASAASHTAPSAAAPSEGGVLPPAIPPAIPPACRELLEAVHTCTCEGVQARFDFSALGTRPIDPSSGEPLYARGPSLSIGLSRALACGEGADPHYTMGFKQAVMRSTHSTLAVSPLVPHARTHAPISRARHSGAQHSRLCVELASIDD